MSRTNPPIGLDAAVAKVKAKAREFVTASDKAAKPAGWGRTYVEPDKSVYLTADKEKSLIAKWEAAGAIDDRFINKGSGSSGGAQVDLKLQLKAKWDSWDAGKSPFVYHIPIDVYHSPQDIKREQDAKKQKEDAAKQKAARELAEKQAAAAKKAADDQKKQAEKIAKQRTEAMNKDWNALKSKPKDQKKWQADWLQKFGGRYKV
jgi:hypothetical protein